MKIPLSSQIAEAEMHLTELKARLALGHDVQSRIDAAEGQLLTLTFNQTYEPEIREYMRQRSKAA